MKVEEALQVEPIDSGPESAGLGIDQIVAATGLLVFDKGTLADKGGQLKEKEVRGIHQESTRRGHASLTTTPAFFFELNGSRLIDLYGSTFPFGSYLIASSRRMLIDEGDLVLPGGLPAGAKDSMMPALRVYQRMWEKDKDQARKVLPLGFHSHGFFKYSAEEIIYMLQETDEPGVPRELGLMAREMGRHLREKAPLLHEAAMDRPSLFYHHPNIFHTERWRDQEGLDVWHDRHLGHELEEGDNWYEVSERAIDRIHARVVSSGSIAMWNELKRHRTALQRAESVYRAADRAFDELNSLSRGEEPEWVHVPPLAGEDYLPAVMELLEAFQRHYPECGEEAVYLVPHCVKLKFAATLNGYHLLHPFGLMGVRTCTTSDYEMRAWAVRAAGRVEERVPLLEGRIGPKCKTGTCPERKPCEILKRYAGQKT